MSDDKKETDRKETSTIRKYLGYAIKWVLPLLLTVLLVHYMFRKVDFADMISIVREGVDWWWILAAMGLSVVSHIVRARRWQLQLRTLGIRPPFLALCCSVFGCYALNLVFPRLGEVWRGTYIARRERVSMSTIFGSLVADRLADSVCVLSIFLLTLVVAFPAINSFLVKYPVGQSVMSLISSVWVWSALVGVLLLLVALFHFGRNLRIIKKLKNILSNLWEGFATVGRMPGWWRFIFYSFAIWGCYFTQLYLAFFAFPFTRALCSEPGLGFGLTPCLVAFILSSLGMAIPSNGGLGPWNLAIMFGLAIYGISDADGATFSMLQWSGQTVMLIILGIFTMGYISLTKNKTKTLN